MKNIFMVSIVLLSSLSAHAGLILRTNVNGAIDTEYRILSIVKLSLAGNPKFTGQTEGMPQPMQQRWSFSEKSLQKLGISKLQLLGLLREAISSGNTFVLECNGYDGDLVNIIF